MGPYGAQSRPYPSDGDRRQIGTAVIAFGLLVAYVLFRDLGASPYDDGYFFARFARNFLRHGVFAWNPTDGPVHGSTSQLFQALAVPIYALFPGYYVAATKAVLAAALLLFFASCCRLVASHRAPLALVWASAASPLVLSTVHTGMETALALALLAAWLHFFERGAPPWALGAMTLLVYLVRPDAALLPTAAFAIRHFGRLRALAAFGGALLAGLTVWWLLAWNYYGTPLPLPFYQKTLGFSPYGESVARAALVQKVRQFGTFAFFAAPIAWIALFGKGRRRLDLLGAAALFASYHLLFTREIMGYHGRFYLPALPFLLLAAAGSWATFERGAVRQRAFALLWLLAAGIAYGLGAVETHRLGLHQALPWTVWLAWSAALILLVTGPRGLPWLQRGIPAAAALAAVALYPPTAGFQLKSDAAILRQHAGEFTTVRGIYDLRRCLPDLHTLYHSEMGIPGLLFPDARVVDLVGLLSNAVALEHEDFETMCQRDRPEAIFLPHRGYATLRARIEASPCFRNYQRMVDQSSAPLYVRRDLAQRLLSCAREIQRWQDPVRGASRDEAR